ncbi:MAG: transporter substrate-binding domain-containing protein [Desulfobacterales bacterium]|nr:transporter substrate-binding domain-containing protein [Desulfobacterales bacterium]
MKKLFVIVASVFLISVQPVLSAELTILTENLPPLNYLKDGVLVGPSVEIVKEIQRRVGSHEQIKVYPWARAYKMALEDENIVLFGTTYTKERHDKFKWIGPLATKRDILVAKKGSGIKINSLEDAKKVKRIGTLRDDTRERLLNSLGFTNLEPVSDEQKNAKKLVLGRIDLWTYKKPGLKTVCELAGVDYNEIEEVYHLRKIDLMIAFSKKTSDSIVQNWRNAFDEMLADGTIMQIRKKWNNILEDDPFPEIEDKL